MRLPEERRSYGVLNMRLGLQMNLQGSTPSLH
jgi:hypothetical protein